MHPLDHWFTPLVSAANAHGSVLRHAATVAVGLLSAPQEWTVLHGDIHHANVLDFGPRGWLAIDSKGLAGERAFDYANLFCNPDPMTAAVSGRLARQVDVVAEAAVLDRRRLLAWVLAWAGLSAAFFLEDGDSPESALAIANLAVAELNR